MKIPRINGFSYALVLLLLVGCSLEKSGKANPIQTATIVLPMASYTSPPTNIPVPTWAATLMPSSTPTRLIPTVPNTLIPPTGTLNPTPTLSPITPGWIAIAGAGANVGVGIINTEGTGLTPLTTGCSFCDSVSWSPDGHWLAYNASYAYMDTVDIYITRIDGSVTRQITYGAHDKAYVAWSPDGEYIAYVELEATGNDICLVNVQNGESRKLTYPTTADSSPAWSPDGKYIAFLRLTSVENFGAIRNWALMIMDADGSNVRQVLDFLAGSGRLAWSPDGQQIAFTSAGNCGEIHSVRTDGSDLRQLTNLPGCAMNPAWSPDGRYIAFEVTEAEPPSFQRQLNIMDADGSVITEIYSTNTGFPLRPDWKPVPSLRVSEAYVITESGANLNLRTEPSLRSTSLLSLQAGDVVTVLEGPMDAEDYYWWRLRTADGTEGWAVEMYGWYLPVSP